MTTCHPDSLSPRHTVRNGRSRRCRALVLAGILFATVSGTGGRAWAAVSGTTADALPDDLVSCLAEARNANAAHDIERERLILEHAEGLGGEAKDAAQVQRQLAVLDWRYHHRFDEARERLERAAEGAEPSDAWAAIARLEQARKDYGAAGVAARQALATAQTQSQRLEALLAGARGVVARGMKVRRSSTIAAAPAAKPAEDPELEASLRQVFAGLYTFVSNEPGLLEPSRLLLRAALLLDEGEAAVVAWRSYYHVAEGIPTANQVATAGEELARILPSWPGAQATAAQRIELIRALADSRFFVEATIVARDPRAGEAVRSDADVRAVIVYADAIERIRELTEENYRLTILGQRDPEALENGVKAELTAVVRAIEGETSKVAASFEDVKDFLDRRFGTFVSLGTTAGYYDLHMGHRVVDDKRTVEQYGERAELRFIALDNMVSNGFQSWAWESGAQHGGWARPNAIYQVRSAYVGGPLHIWRALHDPDELREMEEGIARETPRDDERAGENPYAYLPGLALRFRKEGVLNLLDRLEAEGASGAELRAHFLAELERAQQESSIFAHEGRHAIDKRAGRKGNLEFTAKLSEVAFAPEPRLALGAIFSPGIGDPSPHGQANLRIMKGLVEWMEEHRKEIAGLDAGRPLLPQFDLLTDEQMRVAFRSMDPLAAGVGSR